MGIIKHIFNRIRDYDNEISQESPYLFGFGDPEPVLLRNEWLDSLGIYLIPTGEYYLPPVDFIALAKIVNANPYHGPLLHFKKNQITLWYQPSPILGYHDLHKAALDYLVLGNCFFKKYQNGFGTITRLEHLSALNMRRLKADDSYCQLQPYNAPQPYIEFEQGEILHLGEYDLRQHIYGLPQYLGGVQSVLLSEASTLFRRKYFINGSHMGYIMVTSNAGINEDTAKMIEEKVRRGKGVGNFRNMFINIPKTTDREPVKIIPVGDKGTKDEFETIKNVTEGEACAMHRVPPVLASITPSNTGGFGDVEKARRVYHDQEVIPLQRDFLRINQKIGRQAVIFTEPDFKQLSEKP